MLDEYRRAYVQSADHIPGWQKLTRNELCRKYKQIEREGPADMLDFYVSAIVLNFWHVLTKTYKKQPVKVLSEEDCYECLIESILSVLEQEAWENPTQSIYKDEKGPEKAINLIFQQNIINLFVANQRHKRKASSNTLSLDNTLKDDDDDESDTFISLLAKDELSTILEKLFWKEKVKQYFVEKDYVAAFVTDLLINNPFLIESKDGKYIINSRKIARELNELPPNYAKQFSKEYDIPVKQVEGALSVLKYLYNVNSRSVDKTIHILVRDIKEERA